jgi:hypothetical protein
MKVFILLEVAITPQGNVNEMTVYFNMSSHYTINEVIAKSVVMKPSCNENVQVTNVDQVDRQYETTTVCVSDLRGLYLKFSCLLCK